MDAMLVRTFFISFILLLTQCKFNRNFNQVSASGDAGKTYSLGIENLVLNGKITKHNDSSHAPCDGWELKASDLVNILQKMREVPPVEYYALCYQLPCRYEGMATNGDVDFEIDIYAASYIVLTNNDSSRIFIMEKPDKLFLMPCDCCE